MEEIFNKKQKAAEERNENNKNQDRNKKKRMGVSISDLKAKQDKKIEALVIREKEEESKRMKIAFEEIRNQLEGKIKDLTQQVMIQKNENNIKDKKMITGKELEVHVEEKVKK